ncbi:hypothetical protein [Burkholderia sp. SIMBA_051]|uniref:hypothetical protein n=1 Tax=Burkholderia sp. SIMBA_051 TaxID=3085792 RepID=UPI00397B8513
MAKSNRDDFSEKTKRVLAQRADHRCSFSGCGIRTSAPGEDSPSAIVSIGVAAHIHAASPGGPRYLEGMKANERSDIANGIWLCSNHSILIDREPNRYTADVLRTMKSDHESRLYGVDHASSRSTTDLDFVAIGPDLVLTGELVGASGTSWRIHVDHFLIGDIPALIGFSESFASIEPHDRYVLVNALGDGRQLLAAPTWEKTDRGCIISCDVRPSVPRTNAHRLPADLALNDAHDLFVSNGDLAIVSGLDSLPQKISMCLSTLRGEISSSPTFGARIKEYFDDLRGSPWLPRLIKLEVIRLACIPYRDPIGRQEYTPMHSVTRVRQVEQLLPEADGDWQRFRFQLDVEGVGPSWQCETRVFVPRGTRG